MNGQAERPEQESDDQSATEEVSAAESEEIEAREMFENAPLGTSKMPTDLLWSDSVENSWPFAIAWKWAWRRPITPVSKACWKVARQR
jgi:hypothetical protein